MNSLPIVQYGWVKRKTQEFAALGRAEIEHNTIFKMERKSYEDIGNCQFKPVGNLSSFKKAYK